MRDVVKGRPIGGELDASHALRPLSAILIGAVLLRTWADPDLWGHVRFGLDTLYTWTLPRVDPYSFTQDVPWLNHEWLSELTMGAAYVAGGTVGLLALKVLLLGLTFALVDGLVKRKRHCWRFATLSCCAAALLPLSATIRPQLWTVLLLVALVRLLHSERREAIWGIPLLFTVWANVHGGFVLGLGVLGSVLVGQRLAGRITSTNAVVTWLASLLATLATPYGLELWVFIAHTVRLGRADITEWQPLWRSTPAIAAMWVFGLAIVVLACWRLRARALYALPTALMLAIASLKVIRLVPLFILTVVVLLAPLTEDGSPDETRSWGRALIDSVAALLGLALILPVPPLSCLPIDAERFPDPLMVTALQTAVVRGRLVTSFNWGQYAIFHFGPALRVSVDGRRETVYSESALATQYAIASGSPEGLAALARINAEYVWLPLPSARRTLAWLERNGYRTDVRTTGGFVAVRDDLPRVVPAPVTAATLCFPGP